MDILVDLEFDRALTTFICLVIFISLQYSVKRLEASTMYKSNKKIRPTENSFLFYQNVRIKKPVSLHHLLPIWPEMVLWVRTSKRVFHGTSRT
jgi:hypothetical protein